MSAEIRQSKPVAPAAGRPGTRRWRRVAGWMIFAAGVAVLLWIILLLRLTVVTDHLYHALVKDPERSAPAGDVLVAPADGTVLYVRRIEDGVIPEVVKLGVPVPVVDHIKFEPERPFASGYLVGIYMNTFGVHINRVPDGGTLERQFIFNGPHMDMTDAETKVILKTLVPGWTSVRKLFGLHPYGFEDDADFVLHSARETLVMRDVRGGRLFIVRIADYYVGKILTWVDVGEELERGQRLGMISWGSQTDLFIEDVEGRTTAIEVGVGQYLYGGETVIASY